MTEVTDEGGVTLFGSLVLAEDDKPPPASLAEALATVGSLPIVTTFRALTRAPDDIAAVLGDAFALGLERSPEPALTGATAFTALAAPRADDLPTDAAFAG